LLFSDPARLARIVNDPARPVLLIFAGKAHPHDVPGQQFIKVIHDFSHRPEFEGKVILLEGYDLSLSRKLVTGVDVWVNTPQYPFEASGTSGQKAGINGVLNLSVLDGWWGEGYNGSNGWAITPHGADYDQPARDREEGQELLDILEKEIIPMYYDRNGHGYPERWVKMSKASMKSLIPHYNAQRMLMDYITRFYGPASRQQHILSEREAQPARDLAAWKRHIIEIWPRVTARRVETGPTHIVAGETLQLEMAVKLHGLAAQYVTVECLVGSPSETSDFVVHSSHQFHPSNTQRDETLYRLDLPPPLSGLQYYKIRIFPSHPLLSHRLEMGRMLWI
jgi:starch phosphorylase